MLGHVYTPPPTHLLPNTWENNYTMFTEVFEELDESRACNKLLVAWKFQHVASQLSLILVVIAVGGAEESHGVSLRCSMEKHC